MCVTVVHSDTICRRVRGGGTTPGRFVRVGFALAAIALPLLATSQGRALLTGVLAPHLPRAARPRDLQRGRSAAPGLPAGPGEELATNGHGV